LHVDIEDQGPDFLADGHDVRRVPDSSPGKLGDIDHRDEAADVDERDAERRDLDDGSGACLPWAEALQ
jgi:hypothetical protein